MVLAPVPSGIAKRFCRYISQDVCPWNVRFSKELPNDSPFAPLDVLAGKDARRLARELLVMTQEEFSAAFKGSPMKRAKLRGLRRNAAVVLGNVGSEDDASVLAAALSDEEPLVAGALGRVRFPAASEAVRHHAFIEPADAVRAELEATLDALTSARR